MIGRTCLGLIFLVITALSGLSCGSKFPQVLPVNISVNESTNTSPAVPLRDSPDFRYLSEPEKSQLLQIALNTTEAYAEIRRGQTYSSNFSWVAIVWEGPKASLVYGIDYDAVITGLPPNVPKSAKIYPRVELMFGNPPELLMRTAVDPSTGKPVLIDTHGLKSTP